MGRSLVVSDLCSKTKGFSYVQSWALGSKCPAYVSVFMKRMEVVVASPFPCCPVNRECHVKEKKWLLKFLSSIFFLEMVTLKKLWKMVFIPWNKFFCSQDIQFFVFLFSSLFQSLVKKMIEDKSESLCRHQLAQQEFKIKYFLISWEGK